AANRRSCCARKLRMEAGSYVLPCAPRRKCPWFECEPDQTPRSLFPPIQIQVQVACRGLRQRPCSRWPILRFLVCRYLREILEMRGWQGTSSTTRTPADSSCRTLSGLLESSRIFVAPNFLRIRAGKSYSRTSAAN